MAVEKWLSRRIGGTLLQLNPEEKSMKKHITHAVAALFVLLVAAPLFAVQRNVVDEVIRMTHAGVSVDTMLDYVSRTDARVSVTGDDIIAMSDARVPKEVIKAVVDASDHNRNYRDRSYVAPRVVVAAPYYGYGYGYGYDPYFYDPFFYGPRISLGFGFYRGGFRGGSRGGFHGGHHR